MQKIPKLNLPFIFNISITILVICFIVWYITYALSNGCLNAEDYNPFSTMHCPVAYSLFFIHVRGFADLLNMHPQDCINTVSAVSRGVFFAILCFTVANSLFVKSKRRLLLLSTGAFFVCNLFIAIAADIKFDSIFNCCCWFFEYLTPVLLFAVYIYLYCKICLYSERSRKLIFAFWIMSFLIGMSHLYVIAIFLVLNYLTLNTITVLYRENKFELLKIFSLSYLLMLIPQLWANTKRVSLYYESHVEQGILSADYFDDFYSYLEEYGMIFSENIPLLCTIGLSFLCLYFVLKHNKEKECIRYLLTMSLFFAAITLVYCGLIIGGDSFGLTYGTKFGDTWINHTGLRFITKSYCIILIFCIWSIITSEIKIKFMYYFVIVFLVISGFVLFFSSGLQYIKKMNFNLLQQRITQYKTEKQMLYSSTVQEYPYISMKITDTVPPAILSKKPLQIEQPLYQSEFTRYYIQSVYSKAEIENIILVSPQRAEEIYIKQKGKFTERELIKPKFDDLKDIK